jgi:Cohesin loading factor
VSNPTLNLNHFEAYFVIIRYRHHSWEYVFRLLRASLSLKSAKTSDHQAAMHDLRYVSSLASNRGDHAILILASLMEVLACLSSPSPESQEQIQRAFASARTYQLEPDARIPQLTALTHILDVTCSLLYDLPADTIQKQVAMVKIFKSSAWSTSSDALALPIIKSPGQVQLVSRDTRGILEKAEDGRDALVISFLNNNDACALM